MRMNFLANPVLRMFDHMAHLAAVHAVKGVSASWMGRDPESAWMHTAANPTFTQQECFQILPGLSR